MGEGEMGLWRCWCVEGGVCGSVESRVLITRFGVLAGFCCALLVGCTCSIQTVDNIEYIVHLFFQPSFSACIR